MFLHEKNTTPRHVQYKIRMGKDAVPSTEILKDKYIYLVHMLKDVSYIAEALFLEADKKGFHA